VIAKQEILMSEEMRRFPFEKKKHLKTSDRIYTKINYRINTSGDDKLIEVIWRIISLIRRDEKEKIEGIYR